MKQMILQLLGSLLAVLIVQDASIVTYVVDPSRLRGCRMYRDLNIDGADICYVYMPIVL